MKNMPKMLLSSLLAAAAALPLGSLAAGEMTPVQRGRYLVTVAGCNDCHTAGFAPSGGKVPEQDWLLGDRLGFQGPWGTTYPVNLRLYFAQMDERTWLARARRVQPRPPMPGWALHTMSDEDLVAIYRYTRQLGPIGQPAPAYVPPGTAVAGPVVLFPAPPK